VIAAKPYAQKPTRDGFGEGIIELARRDPNVVVLDADVAKSTRTEWFKKIFPERFFDMGISEQDLLGTAAGLALGGKIPFVTTYGVFVTGRAWDQIRNSICYPEMNVKIGGAHGGITVGPDGATHQALEEIALMRVLPNMKVIVPCDAIETYKAILTAAETPGPVFIRFGREAVPTITTPETPFRLGKAEVFRDGGDLSIVACGLMVHAALEAAEILAEKGIQARVINLHTIKPIDVETLVKAAEETKFILTVEEHQVIGGLGSAVAEVLGEHIPTPMKRVGILDTFGESGDSEELLRKYGLHPETIAQAALELLKR
jgi:transketolase